MVRPAPCVCSVGRAWRRSAQRGVPVGCAGGGAGFRESWRQDTTCSRRGSFSACWCRKVGIEGGSYHGWVSRNVGNAQIARPPRPHQPTFAICLRGGACVGCQPCLTPPPSGRQVGKLHGEGLDMPTTRRYAAFTQSGVGECRGAFNAGPGCREGSPKGESSRSAGQSSQTRGGLRAAPGMCFERPFMYWE